MADVLTVKLGDRGYPIVLGEDVGREVQAKIAQLGRAGKRIAVMTDEHVAAKQAAALKAMFGDAPTWTVAPGEPSKSLAELGRALEYLAEQAFGRSDAIFAVGGGVIGDLGGFTAATYLRGIDYYQVPTTLLAMVDSSVGGKTGVNLAAGKNLAGAFHQPRGVFVSTSLLKTLPAREFAAGAAEILKTGLLGDASLFAQLEENPLKPGDARLPEIIKRCCAIKAGIVESDERELAKEGGRALLNLGHTFGHAIEQATGYAAYLHGEAVAIGLVAAARLSQELDLISAEDAARVGAAVRAHGLPVKLKAKLPLAELMEATTRDKKVRAGQRRFVVLQAIGAAAVRAEIDPARVEAGFRAVGAA
jgi:3-dehydroquinate synthase